MAQLRTPLLARARWRRGSTTSRPALGVAHENSAQAVFALMHQPRQSVAVRQACREALREHGRRETEVLRRLMARFDPISDF